MQPTEAQLLERRIWRHFSKGLTQYHLLDDGDHILLGLCLLYTSDAADD